MLFDLVKSLSKAEKRHFKIYAKSINQDGIVLFLDLFNYMDKQDHFDTLLILRDLPTINESQLSNVKRSLYNHILSSLSLLYDLKKPSLKIRSFMNYTELLYARGLYLQSLKILLRAKKIALKSHEDELHLDIINQEQKIQSRHITRSTTTKMEELIHAANDKLNIKVNISALSNLKLYLQRQFINHGPELSCTLIANIESDFESKMLGFEVQTLSLFEQIYYYQCYYWMFYLKQDFEQCYHFAQKCDSLFNQHPSMMEKDFDLFLICRHHLLNMLFFTKRVDSLNKYCNSFKPYAEDKSLNLNSFLLANLFHLLVNCDNQLSKQNSHKTNKLIKAIKDFLDQYSNHFDSYKIKILHYKAACLYIINNHYNPAIDHLNEIINSKNPLRQEIVSYTRILLIICYIEIQNDELAMHFTTQTKRYIKLSNQSNEQMRTAINFFLKLLRSNLLDRPMLYKDFLNDLEKNHACGTQKRAIIFIDFKRWVNSKVKSQALS